MIITYKHQIIIISGDFPSQSERFKIFENSHLQVTISTTDINLKNVEIVKELVDPRHTRAIYFKDPNLTNVIASTGQTYFENNSMKFIESKTFLILKPQRNIGRKLTTIP